MNKKTKRLPLLLMCLLALGGYLVYESAMADENEQPYTEEAAEFDPAVLYAIELREQAQAEAEASEEGDGSAEEAPAEETPDEDAAGEAASGEEAGDDDARTPDVVLTDDQWRSILSDAEFYVLRRSGTELRGTGRYLDNDDDEFGAYHCVGCGNYLYDARHKFHSGCGWPSFNQEVAEGAITTYVDRSHGMVRTEMRCARCDGHLGHIFRDAPDQPTGLRHCVNGTALIFVPAGQEVGEVITAHREQWADR